MSGHSPLRVLVAIDDDPPSQDAIAFAERQLPSNADVLVLNVVTSVLTSGRSALGPAPVEATDQARAAIRSRAREVARSAAAALPHDADVTVEDGDPAATICAVAEDNDIDLIIVGTHDHSVWSRLWYGSVARYVATHAPCSVLVVR